MKAATCAQIRELDRLASEQFSIPSLLLMENAGQGAAHHILETLDSSAEGPVVIVCGKGNNGGDGFVVARHLSNQGVEVEVVLVAPRESISPKSDPGINLAILEAMGLAPGTLPIGEALRSLSKALPQASHIVDALLGTGLSGEVRSPSAEAIDLINDSGLPITSLDTPSGLDADTGQILGRAIRATSTVTFALPKVGFTLEQGPEHVGKLLVVDISIPRILLQEIPS